jgi:hypothetical protein
LDSYDVSLAIAIFPVVKVKKYHTNYWRLQTTHCINTLQYCSRMTSSRLQNISVNRQNIFEGRTKIVSLLCGPGIGLYNVRKLYRILNNGRLFPAHYFASIKRPPMFSFLQLWNKESARKFNPSLKLYSKQLRLALLYVGRYFCATIYCINCHAVSTLLPFPLPLLTDQ